MFTRDPTLTWAKAFLAQSNILQESFVLTWCKPAHLASGCDAELLGCLEAVEAAVTATTYSPLFGHQNFRYAL